MTYVVGYVRHDLNGQTVKHYVSGPYTARCDLVYESTRCQTTDKRHADWLYVEAVRIAGEHNSLDLVLREFYVRSLVLQEEAT